MSATEQEVEEEVSEAAATKIAEEEKIKAAFEDAVSADKTDDEVKMVMIQNGASFKNVTRLYNQFMIDAGLAVSKEDKDASVAKVCEGQDLTSEEVFAGICSDLVANVTGATERSAASWIRSYAKKNELECWKKPKGEGVGRSGFTSDYCGYISAEARTPEQAKAYIMGTDGNGETTDNVKKSLNLFMLIYNTLETAVTNRG